MMETIPSGDIYCHVTVTDDSPFDFKVGVRLDYFEDEDHAVEEIQSHLREVSVFTDNRGGGPSRVSERMLAAGEAIVLDNVLVDWDHYETAVQGDGLFVYGGRMIPAWQPRPYPGVR